MIVSGDYELVPVDCDDDLATYNDAALLELLQDLADTPDGLEGTGFTGDDLDDLIARLNTGDHEPEDAEEDAGPAVYGVAVACQSEDHREELMARLTEWGWEPRKVDGDWLRRT